MKTWQELNPGAVITEPGSSRSFKTGSWRSYRPTWVEENCCQCMLCWLYCPDMSVKTSEGKRGEFDYDFCKGCGICALECPGKKGQKAIVMTEGVSGPEPDTPRGSARGDEERAERAGGPPSSKKEGV